MRFLILAALGTALVGCKGGTGGDETDGGGAYSLALSGTGYDPHIGATLYAHVIDSTGAQVGDEQTVDLTSGSWSVDFTDILAEGEDYTAGWYVDIDASASCDDPPTDHVWTHDMPAVDADQTFEHAHSTDFALCADAGY
jgi:hypothetical protein